MVYTKIDLHFHAYRPDSAYRAIEKMCKASQHNILPWMSAQYQTGVELHVPYTPTPNPHYQKHNIDRREARRDKRIEGAKCSGSITRG